MNINELIQNNNMSLLAGNVKQNNIDALPHISSGIVKDQTNIQNEIFFNKSEKNTITGTDIYHPGDDNISNVVQTDTKGSEALAVLNGDDCKDLSEKEKTPIEEYEADSFERAVDRIKSERAWKKEKLEEREELLKEIEKDFEEIKIKNIISEKTAGQIKHLLSSSGIPVTDDILSQVTSALSMSGTIADMDDSAKKGIILSGKTLTIENIYNSAHLGITANTFSASDENQWEEYAPQVEKILRDADMLSEENTKNAKWLFVNELPIDENTLNMCSEIEKIRDDFDIKEVLKSVLDNVSLGFKAAKTIPGNTDIAQAKEIYSEVIKLSPYNIYTSMVKRHESEPDKSQPLNLQELINQTKEEMDAAMQTVSVMEDGSGVLDDIMTVTAKRRLTEIQLTMTTNDIVRLRRQGINVEREPLEDLASRLRAIENEYYVGLTDDEADIMSQTLSDVRDIQSAPAAFLGHSINTRGYMLMTFKEIHAISVSFSVGVKEFNTNYEAVGTEVRSDLGDSIKKAFSNIDSLMEENDIEITVENERAVRILGYNNMEITKDNVMEVKLWDSKLNRILDGLTPKNVFKLIKEGVNPLELDMDSLYKKIEEYNIPDDVQKEEKYSRFLWELEKNKEISQEERKGYIAIERLLYQIQKDDGACIGAVIQAGGEVNLKNLMTAVRTGKSKGVDVSVDDETGINTSDGSVGNITSEIEDYFAGIANKVYNNYTTGRMINITGNDMQKMYEMPIERLSEELEIQALEDDSFDEYFEEESEIIRDSISGADRYRDFLSSFGISNSIANIMGAQTLLASDHSPIMELYKKKDILDDEERENLEQLADEVSDDMDSPDIFEKKVNEINKHLRNILNKSEENDDISFDEMRNLKMLANPLRLQSSLVGRHNYNIPLMTDAGMVTVNLTLVSNAEKSGMVKISLDETVLGNFSAEFNLTENKDVKGFILCDTRNGYEVLKDRSDILTGRIESAGYDVKTLSFGMDFKSRDDLLSGSKEENTPAGDLYRIAKMTVTWVSETANIMTEKLQSERR